MGRLSAMLLLATATVCGAVVMAVELLGARMLSVAFGGSIIVWAAMISVTMLSLAVGYFVGGWLSDRWPRPGLLYAVLLVAAGLVAACPHGSFIISRCYDAFGIRGGALASSTIIFFLPLGLLGMVSPSIIRMLCTSGHGVGIRAGSVYAISTLGSVAGTLLTGLWLVPSYGTAAGFAITSVALACVAAIGLLTRIRLKAAPLLLVPVAIYLMPAPVHKVGQEYTAPGGEHVKILAVRDSAYGQISVLQKGDYRLLVVDGIVQTGLPANLGRLTKGQMLANSYFQELLPYMTDEPGKSSALLIGLAGGMTASMLKLYDMDIEAVDLDPQIISVAREFFWFDGKAHAADGRQFLDRCTRKYDFCVIDTYSGDVFPFHLASLEAFQSAKSVLKPDGVLALNYIGAPTGRAFACLYLTLNKAFKNVMAIRGERSDDVQTITLLAADRPIEFKNGLYDGLGQAGAEDVLYAIADLTVTPDIEHAFILRDDYNPIDYLRGDDAINWRQRTARIIGQRAIF